MSTSRQFFEQGRNQELQAQLAATPSAGAKTITKGANQRIYHSDDEDASENPDMRQILRFGPSLKSRSMYQSAHAPEAVQRFHRQRIIGKKMSKEEKETRWHTCLLQRWSRNDDVVSKVSTNYSLLPAGKRNDDSTKKDKAKPATKKKNTNDETQLDQPSAWALERAKESKQSQYLTQYQKTFVARVAGAVNDAKAVLAKKTQHRAQQSSIWKSIVQDLQPSDAQESSYQSAFGNAKTRALKKKKRDPFEDFSDF